MESKGDLISRKALKEDISKVVAEERKEDEKWALGLKYALKLIDNAQTVHFIDVFNNNSYLNSYRSYSEPEPNKYISSIDTECIMLECPECKSRIISTAFSFAVGTKGYSFCPYCGADMRKGDAM